MGEYMIKQNINTSSVPPTVFDENKGNLNYLCIVCSNGTYGIANSNGETILPMEYDNISLAGFDLFLLIQKGKMGLLHIERSSGGDAQTVSCKKQISCEYDVITFPHDGESFVLLRKDNEKSSYTQIYFSKSGVISEAKWKVKYHDRDYIIVVDADRRKEQIYYSNGALLHSSSIQNPEEGFGHIFETFYGTMFIKEQTDRQSAFVFVQTRYSKNHSLLDIPDEDIKAEPSVACGEFVYPIVTNNHTFSDVRSYAVGFIVKKDEKYFPLYDSLTPINEQGYSTIKVIPELSMCNHDGKQIKLPLMGTVFG